MDFSRSFLILTIVIGGFINTRNNLKAYEANDIKYMRLKVKADTALLRRLYRTDSLFTVDPEAFRTYTIEEENRIAERARYFSLRVKRKGKRKIDEKGQKKMIFHSLICNYLKLCRMFKCLYKEMNGRKSYG